MTPHLDKNGFNRIKMYADSRDFYDFYKNRSKEKQELLDFFEVDSLKKVNDIIQKTPLWSLPYDFWKEVLDAYGMKFDKKTKEIKPFLGVKILNIILPGKKAEDETKHTENYIAWWHFLACSHKLRRWDLNNQLMGFVDNKHNFDDIMQQALAIKSYDQLAWDYIIKKQVTVTINGEIKVIKNLVKSSVEDHIKTFIKLNPAYENKLSKEISSLSGIKVPISVW